LWGAPRIHGELLKLGIAAIDLFVVPTISFRLLYGLLIMGHGRRKILWFGVTARPTAEWIANQLTEACGWERNPSLLSHYNLSKMIALLSRSSAASDARYDRAWRLHAQ
jgi:hypothetical protein